MKHISILVPEGVIINSLDVTIDIFLRVNELLESQRKNAFCKIELVGLSKKVHSSNKLFTVHVQKLLSEVKNTDIIIIPGISGNFKQVVKQNRDMLPWIEEHYKKGAEIASLCVGVFILAATGILKNKQCTVQWSILNEFRELYPDTKPGDTKIITDEDGIYTCGGSFSYMNLLLYLIEKFVDRQMAVLISKLFQIEISRQDQAPYIIFSGQKNHKDIPVKKVQEYIEKNYPDRITLDGMASMVCIGRRSLERRFKKATYNTIAEYIQRVKVEAAKKGFETSRKNILDVMHEVGYIDVRAFRDVFKKYTGLTPAQYKSKYRKGV